MGGGVFTPFPSSPTHRFMMKWRSMYEQMEESADRCWAFNKSGQRCEMVAGHDRDHNVIIAWTNDECWAPGDTPKTPVRQPSVEHLTSPLPTRCALCNHGWHEGRCRAMDGDFACDCAAGIPE